MGLKSSSIIFCRLIQKILETLGPDWVFAYVDDLIMIAKSLEQHSIRLRQLLQRLKETKLLIDPKKCFFLRRELKVLGHIVGNNKITPSPDKIEAVEKFPNPNTVKKIRQFLGLSGFYRKFIKDVATIAKPLTNLLKKDEPFIWDNEQEIAFNTLKQKLCEYPILIFPDFTKPFYICCDASDIAISAILEQLDSENREQVHI